MNTTKKDKAAIKAAMQRAGLFLVTETAKMPTQRAYHRVLVETHLWAAVEQALRAGEDALAHQLHEVFMQVHYGQQPDDGAPALTNPTVTRAAPDPQPAPADRPRRKLVPKGSPGQRARAKLKKRGAVQVEAPR